MTVTAPSYESTYYNQCHFDDQIQHLIASFHPAFHRLSRSEVYFHLGFFFLLLLELALMTILFSLFWESAILGLSLAVFFFTLFSYFTLRLHLKGKKPNRFSHLKDQFVDNCRNLIGYEEGIPEHHIAIANACGRLKASLHGKEYSFYLPPSWLEPFQSTCEKISCWLHWEDVFLMKELLLNQSVAEHIQLVTREPTSLESHIALANAYILLSSLYIDPRMADGYGDDRWIPPGAFGKKQKAAFRAVAQKAIEEFTILNEYAPNDPWVHLQLAYCYHDLQMPKEEIREYEYVVRLRPDDKESLYKLGLLYFQHGMNAQGLKVYEELKHTHYNKAERLIGHYGEATPSARLF